MEIATGKAFDLSQGKLVDVPMPNGPEAKPEEKKPEEEEKNTEEKSEEKKAEEKEKPEGEKKTEEEKKPEEEEAKPAVVDFSAQLKDKFGIESEDQLKKILEYNDTVKEELEKEKKKEPAFKSERQKKILNWLDESGYDLEHLNEGLESAGTLMGLVVDKMDGRRALEEAFILDNTDISRDKAKKLFNKDFEKYSVKEDSFTDKAEFEEAKELAEIKREKDEAKARKFLKAEQEKLKAAPAEKKAQEEQKPIEAPPEAVQSYTQDLDKIFDNGKGKKFDRFIFQDDKDATLKVEVVIPKDKLDILKQASKDYLKNPGIYDDKKKIPNFDPVALIEQVAFALYGRTLLEDTFKNALTLGKSVKAEQLAGLKPDKESKGKGEGGIPSVEQQFMDLAKKRKAEKK